MNKYLADSRNSDINEKQKPVTVDDMGLGDDDKIFHSSFRDMLRIQKK